LVDIICLLIVVHVQQPLLTSVTEKRGLSRAVVWQLICVEKLAAAGHSRHQDMVPEPHVPVSYEVVVSRWYSGFDKLATSRQLKR